MKANNQLKLNILMPVYNDMDIAVTLIEHINNVLENQNVTASIVLINDGSTDVGTGQYLTGQLKYISFVDVVNLERNIGHQRAIAVGLTKIYEEYPCDAVLVMDADGEDKPEDIPRLIQEYKNHLSEKIVFAERRKRSESLLFKVSYKIYQIVHFILTGIAVKVGNFSILPSKFLSNLVLVSELWNHYAAAIFVSKLPYETLLTNRGNRLDKKSAMSFTSLIIHGLSAISVFANIVGVRLLLFSIFMFIITLALLAVIILIKITSLILIPSWLFLSIIFFLFFLLLMTIGCFAMVFIILMSRFNLNFIPKRDCKQYIGITQRIYG